MRPLSRLAPLVVATALLASCHTNDVTSTAVKESRAVTFPSSDGVELSGRLFGPDSARTGIVLAHMLPADESSWYEFAIFLSQGGYKALTFDFRGYCPGGDAGCSQGSKQVSAIWQDVAGAVTFLRAQGVSHVALVGASMGGTASLVVASMPAEQIAAVLTLSAPQSIEGLAAGPDVIQRVTVPKLFIAGNVDPSGAADAVNAFCSESTQPVRCEIFPSADHGTDLLSGNQSENVRMLILNWLQQFVPS